MAKRALRRQHVAQYSSESNDLVEFLAAYGFGFVNQGTLLQPAFYPLGAVEALALSQHRPSIEKRMDEAKIAGGNDCTICVWRGLLGHSGQSFTDLVCSCHYHA